MEFTKKDSAIESSLYSKYMTLKAVKSQTFM